MADVIHNPDTDWCACEPNSDRRCDYRLLADAVINAFNPPDRDEAEVAICVDAITRAAATIAASDCRCGLTDPDDASAPCPRCTALGQWRGRPVSQ